MKKKEMKQTEKACGEIAGIGFNRSIDEILEVIWVLKEQEKNNLTNVLDMAKQENVAEAENVIKDMEKRGLIKVDKKQIQFSDQGHEHAEGIIRRHRLAERLFSDVFQLSEDLFEDPACQFEHILSREVTDSVCTFLGHPPVCPHGKPIPRADCCNNLKKEIRPLVRKLKDIEIGKNVNIVFMVPGYHIRLDRLSTLGIHPGSTLRIHQKYPSFVLEVGETTIAVDEEIANEIYVKEEVRG